MVRWEVQSPVLAETGAQLEAMEECKTSRRDERETDCGP